MAEPDSKNDGESRKASKARHPKENNHFVRNILVSAIAGIAVLIIAGLFNTVLQVNSLQAKLELLTITLRGPQDIEDIVDELEQGLAQSVSLLSLFESVTTQSDEAINNVRSSTAIAEELSSENEEKLRRGVELADQLLDGDLQEFVETDQFLESVAQRVSPIPNDAVVAFASPRGCPQGWTEFADATGRVVIGQGQGAGLTSRSYRAIGGQERVTLTEAEMPAHTHTVSHSGSGNPNAMGGFLVSRIGPDEMEAEGETNPIGGGQPHENMPPFIALYFCTPETEQPG